MLYPQASGNAVQIATNPFGLSLSKPQEALRQAQGERLKVNSIEASGCAASLPPEGAQARLGAARREA